MGVELWDNKCEMLFIDVVFVMKIDDWVEKYVIIVFMYVVM